MTHPTKGRTFDRETWLRAMDARRLGRFGPEWADWFNLAGKAGIIFPPDGSPSDSWSDAKPSQRAVLIRAIRETPRLLRWALTRPGVESWGDVIGHLFEGRDRMALEAEQREHDWTETKRSAPPAHVGSLLGVVADSMGVER